MNIDREEKVVEDANWDHRIYKSKHWDPIRIHSTPLSAKGKILLTLNYSLLLSSQRPVVRVTAVLSFQRKIEKEEENVCMLGLSGLWDSIALWIVLQGLQKSFLCSAEEKGVYLPALVSRKKIGFCPKSASHALEKIFHASVVWILHEFPSKLQTETILHIRLWKKKSFKIIIGQIWKIKWPNLLRCTRDNPVNFNHEVPDIFLLLSNQSRDFYMLNTRDCNTCSVKIARVTFVLLSKF